MMPRIKICCISSLEEANTAIRHGAAALGLVGRMPSGPSIIDDHLIATIARSAPPAVGTFLLTSETEATAIARHHQQVMTNTIQIVDKLHTGRYQDIRTQVGPVKLVQVIHVMDESSIDEALEIQDQVDALLLDSGNPTLAVKELGGTGRTHNWDISRRLVDAVSVPVFLAGGLTPENVRQAIDTVQPFGLDLCSGVRTNGSLDPVKLERFFEAAFR